MCPTVAGLIAYKLEMNQCMEVPRNIYAPNIDSYQRQYQTKPSKRNTYAPNVQLGAYFIHVARENSDQAGRMPRAGRIPGLI